MEPAEEGVLEMLNELEDKEFSVFNWHLEDAETFEAIDLQPLSKSRLENADRKATAKLIVQTYPKKHSQVMINVLRKTYKNDQADTFPNIDEVSDEDTSGLTSADVTDDSNTPTDAVRLGLRAAVPAFGRGSFRSWLMVLAVIGVYTSITEVYHNPADNQAVFSSGVDSMVKPWIEDCKREQQKLIHDQQDLKDLVELLTVQLKERERELEQKDEDLDFNDLESHLHDTSQKMREREGELQNTTREIEDSKREQQKLIQDQQDLKDLVEKLTAQLKERESELEQKDEDLRKTRMEFNHLVSQQQQKHQKLIQDQQDLKDLVEKLTVQLKERERELEQKDEDLRKTRKDFNHLVQDNQEEKLTVKLKKRKSEPEQKHEDMGVGPGGLKVKRPATTTSDAVFEPLEGFYCVSSTNDGCIQAQKHINCKPGQYIFQRGTKSTDTVCADCTGDTYSDGTFTTCQQHTDCESIGLPLITPGDHSSDSTRFHLQEASLMFFMILYDAVVVCVIFVGALIIFYSPLCVAIGKIGTTPIRPVPGRSRLALRKNGRPTK